MVWNLIRNLYNFHGCGLLFTTQSEIPALDDPLQYIVCLILICHEFLTMLLSFP